jgi:hypothetical protein
LTPKNLGGWGLKYIWIFVKALAAKYLWVFLTKDSLLRRILVDKYVSPGTILNWICRRKKSRVNVSKQWWALTLAFLLIGNFLAWKVGSGSLVRIEQDVILG